MSSLQLDNFKNEISTFCSRVKRLNEQIEAVDDSQLSNLKEFIQTACGAIHLLEKRQADLNDWKTKLAEYFCEDTTYFKLEECFSTLFKFCDRIKKGLQQNQERRCSELKRSSSIRGSRRFLGSSCDTQASVTNSNLKTVQQGYNRRISSSIGRYSMVIENQINDLVDSTPEFQSFSAVSNQNLLADDLDNELARCSFFRRSTRLSRKSSVTKNITEFDEQSRELLNSRSSFRNFFKDNQEKTIVPTLDTNTIETGIETRAEVGGEKESTGGTEDGTESDYLVPPVVLRRSQSTSEYDNNNATHYYKPLFRSRREIPTLGLSEEDSESQQVKLRNQSKSSNRLSGLKKLGSLYKTFEDDDINLSHHHQQNKASGSGRSSNQFEENLSFQVDEKNGVDAEKESQEVKSHSFMSSMDPSGLESKRVLFEANKKAAQEKQISGAVAAAAVLSSNSGYNEKHPTQLQAAAFNRSSKLRHTVHQNASNLVTDRIIKFESRNEITQVRILNILFSTH